MLAVLYAGRPGYLETHDLGRHDRCRSRAGQRRRRRGLAGVVLFHHDLSVHAAAAVEWPGDGDPIPADDRRAGAFDGPFTSLIAADLVSCLRPRTTTHAAVCGWQRALFPVLIVAAALKLVFEAALFRPSAKQAAHADETIGPADDGRPGQGGEMAICAGDRRRDRLPALLDLAAISGRRCGERVLSHALIAGQFARPAGRRTARTLPVLHGRRRPADAGRAADMKLYRARRTLDARAAAGAGRVSAWDKCRKRERPTPRPR